MRRVRQKTLLNGFRHRIDLETQNAAIPVTLEAIRPVLEVDCGEAPRGEDGELLEVPPPALSRLVDRTLEGDTVTFCVTKDADLSVEIRRAVAADKRLAGLMVHRDGYSDLEPPRLDEPRKHLESAPGDLILSHESVCKPSSKVTRQDHGAAQGLAILLSNLGTYEQAHLPTPLDEPRHTPRGDRDRRRAEVACRAVVLSSSAERGHVEGPQNVVARIEDGRKV